MYRFLIIAYLLTFHITRYIHLVKVIDGGDVIAKYCGNNPPRILTSTSEFVTLKFVTQEPSTGKGFEAAFVLLGEM